MAQRLPHNPDWRCQYPEARPGDLWRFLGSGHKRTSHRNGGRRPGTWIRAQIASATAVRVPAEPQPRPEIVLEYAHGALRTTRGAAVAVARIDRANRKVTFAGVGNVGAAQICSGSTTSQHMVSLNGTVGHQTPTVREFSYPWPEDGILVLYSDGLSSGAGFEAYTEQSDHFKQYTSCCLLSK